MAWWSLSASGCPRYASAVSTWRTCCANGCSETRDCPKSSMPVKVWTTVRLEKAMIADTWGDELKPRFMVTTPSVRRILHIQAAQEQECQNSKSPGLRTTLAGLQPRNNS